MGKQFFLHQLQQQICSNFGRFWIKIKVIHERARNAKAKYKPKSLWNMKVKKLNSRYFKIRFQYAMTAIVNVTIVFTTWFPQVLVQEIFRRWSCELHVHLEGEPKLHTQNTGVSSNAGYFRMVGNIFFAGIDMNNKKKLWKNQILFLKLKRLICRIILWLMRYLGLKIFFKVKHEFSNCKMGCEDFWALVSSIFLVFSYI